MEEATLRGWCDSAAQVIADLSEFGAPPSAIFLEEAQWLDAAALFVKGLVDARLGVPIVVTGSSSFHLLDRVRESLAGRATRHVLLPFSLAEVAPTGGAASRAALFQSRHERLTRMLAIGGYPEAWLGERPAEVLGDLLQACVLRDASDLFTVDRLDAYTRLLELCARQIGNLVNVAELASLTGVATGTVNRYLRLLEESHVLRLVPSYSAGKRREVTSARKV